MDQDPAVVPIGQGTTDTPHQGGPGSHLNPEEGPPHAVSPGGGGYPDTSANGGDLGQTPVREGDFRVSTATIYGVGRRSVKDKGRVYEGVSKGWGTRKGPRSKTVG